MDSFSLGDQILHNNRSNDMRCFKVYLILLTLFDRNNNGSCSRSGKADQNRLFFQFGIEYNNRTLRWLFKIITKIVNLRQSNAFKQKYLRKLDFNNGHITTYSNLTLQKQNYNCRID